MKRLTDDQLSRVLSAFEGRTLGPSTLAGESGTACLVQTAHVHPETLRFNVAQTAQMRWFDRWARWAEGGPLPVSSVEGLLQELERAGLA